MPSGPGKEKVVCKKDYGDWWLWFAEHGAVFFKPAYTPYMQAVGYDCDDWKISTEPLIEPEFSSQYMQRLPRKAKKNLIMRFVDNLLQRFSKKS